MENDLIATQMTFISDNMFSVSVRDEKITAIGNITHKELETFVKVHLVDIISIMKSNGITNL